MEILQETEIEKITNALQKNEIIGMPTDTVYGLCGKMNEEVYQKLIQIKERPIEKSFPIMCCDKNQMKDIAIINEKTEKMIKKWMPGPLTIIVKKKEHIKNGLTNNKDTIALRMAPTKNIAQIIRKLDCPIFMTSANISGKEPCHTIEEIKENFPTLKIIVEGKTQYQEASTIIDCTEDEIKVIRKGPITEKQLLQD